MDELTASQLAEIDSAFKDKFEALKTKYGKNKVRRVELDDVQPGLRFVLLRPDSALYTEFRKKALDEESRDVALENLTRNCVVYPEKPEFLSLMDEFPALGETLGGLLLKMAGASQKAEAKK